MQLPLEILNKRLTLLENITITYRLVKLRYFLNDAVEKLSIILGEKLNLIDVIDLAIEAKQSLWLNAKQFTNIKNPYKLREPKLIKISVYSKECKINPFLKDSLAFEHVECVTFSNGISCVDNSNKFTIDKALGAHVYLDRMSINKIIRCVNKCNGAFRD